MQTGRAVIRKQVNEKQPVDKAVRDHQAKRDRFMAIENYIVEEKSSR